MAFPRGSGPLVSVLIPTRGRHERLVKAVQSIYQNTLDHDMVETLIRVDADDTKTCTVAHQMAAQANVRVLVGQKGQGYADLHHMYNDLAALSRGDWLFVFNDDAEIRTRQWDQMIRMLTVNHEHHKPEICMLYASTDTAKIDTSFPILRREVYELCGHMSQFPYVDDSLRAVMFFVRSAFRVPIEIAHDPISLELSGDKTAITTVNAHQWIAARQSTASKVRGMWDDVGKILDYLEK